jgi:hypothetical protein
LEACTVAVEDTEAPDEFELCKIRAAVAFMVGSNVRRCVDLMVVHRMGLTVIPL